MMYIYMFLQKKKKSISSGVAALSSCSGIWVGGRTAFSEQGENTVLESSQLPASSCSSQN